MKNGLCIGIFFFMIIGSFSFTTHTLALHPLKLTTTIVTWNEKEKCADVTVRVFRDDFQDKLNIEYKSRYNVIKFHTEAEVRKIVSTFFKTYIRISINEKECDWVCVNSESNEDMNALTFFYKIKSVTIKKKNTIALQNSILLKYFPAQVNVMRLNLPGMKEESLINFKEGYTTETIGF
ncbi:MAG: hypothetical protein IAF38_22150 [Bacteroidia bacterium]|nr:hypothetical protein [Bacteroidia bacterium]